MAYLGSLSIVKPANKGNYNKQGKSLFFNGYLIASPHMVKLSIHELIEFKSFLKTL